jgi:hypothetical protein
LLLCVETILEINSEIIKLIPNVELGKSQIKVAHRKKVDLEKIILTVFDNDSLSIKIVKENPTIMKN